MAQLLRCKLLAHDLREVRHQFLTATTQALVDHRTAELHRLQEGLLHSTIDNGAKSFNVTSKSCLDGFRFGTSQEVHSSNLLTNSLHLISIERDCISCYVRCLVLHVGRSLPDFCKAVERGLVSGSVSLLLLPLLLTLLLPLLPLLLTVLLLAVILHLLLLSRVASVVGTTAEKRLKNGHDITLL